MKTASTFNTRAGKNAPAGIPKTQILEKIKRNQMPADFSTALSIAVDSLCFKKGWSAEAYIKHCLTVADATNMDLSEDEIIVGILHDVVEDTDWDYTDLRKVGFSKKIIDGVKAVTKNKGEKYFDGIKRCSKNTIGRRVKRRDNHHNMQLTRAPFAAGVKQKYLYHISWTYLSAVERKEIRLGSSIWAFLEMPEYAGLLTRKNYHYIAQQTSEMPPRVIKLRFGEPRYDLRHP